MLSRYLMFAHWAVFCAGVFVVAQAFLGWLQYQIMVNALASEGAFHSTYVVRPDRSMLLSLAAVIAVTAANSNRVGKTTSARAFIVVSGVNQ